MSPGKCNRMRKLQLMANKTFQLSDQENAPPAVGEVQIKVLHCGICSSDVARTFQSGAYSYPLVPGHEFSGEVTAIGSGVEGFQIGSRVGVFPLIPCFKCSACQQGRYAQCSHYSYYGSRQQGGFSEKLNVKAWNLIGLPSEVSSVDAALLEPSAVVYHALMRSNIMEKNDPGTVLVNGVGFLGLLLIDLLKKLVPNASVFGVDRNQFKLDLSNLEINHRNLSVNVEQFKIWAEEHRDQFGIIFETTGKSAYLNECLKLLKPGGTLILVGNPSEDLNLTKKEISQFLRKEIKMLGIWNSDFNPQNSTDDWHEVLALMKKGFLPSKYISKLVSLEEVPEVLRQMFEHKQGAQHFPLIKAVCQLPTTHD